ncbi:E1-like protein-activating enzyme Gsa7p/Apg7p [Backusella circina FSU 941]|nr:E1-like protein-activating enzyme Gsa7p/Apg7p [Backusella circina FSU 941]
MTLPILKFTPFQSAVDAAFWQSLVSKKLDVLKLSDEEQPLHGYYAIGQTAVTENEESVALPSLFSIPAFGLDMDKVTTKLGYTSTGTLVNTNTIEEFRTIDKNQLFQHITEKITKAVQTGDALNHPEVLSSFSLLTFADLKKYKFFYWFAFPAIMPQPNPWTTSQKMTPVTEFYSAQELVQLDQTYQQWKKDVNSIGTYFLLKKDKDGLKVANLNEYDVFFKNVTPDNRIFGFADPSNSSTEPGWPLRNFLYLIHETFHAKKVKILCYRVMAPKSYQSYMLETELPETSNYTDVKSVGWERNVQGKLGPRMADLGPLMDPTRLADTAVDLNLKLMKWRLLPELNLEKIKSTKCLLLGAGTLGCYVARCLLGWGVRHISFVDNGKVSFSNPVRQPLYTFDDSLEGGSPKAEAAAKHLKLIQPTMQSTGYNLSIPMPGHPYSSDDRLSQDIQTLSELIESHDVIFLLTDSRESRWFPTMLATKMNKIVINSALGFDTYLVMRHGSKKNNLGCYFCNDIVAPTDSLTERTLDQQCTVTRPGLAAIASALSVELMVSLLQHPNGIDAQADTTQTSTPSSILGLLPHQIRGFLGQFSNMLIVGQAYDKCTACSEKITDNYDKEHLDFMKKVLQDPLYLEDLTGLAAMKAESEALLLQDDWADFEEDF